MTHSFELTALHAVQGSFPVLRGVDFHISGGEQVALLGPSGAGKTSLLRVLGGTLAPSAGGARLLDTETHVASPRAMRELRSRIGFVHQDLALVPNLRVLQNVLAGRLGRFGTWSALRSLLWPSGEQKREVLTLLEELGIGEKLFEHTQKLSGGEQQRVALARALYQEPQALLADEPVASVDPNRSRSVLQLLQRVARERSIPLVVSLHQAELAREFFPRLIGLKAGRVLFDASPSEISAAQMHALYADSTDTNELPSTASTGIPQTLGELPL